MQLGNELIIFFTNDFFEHCFDFIFKNKNKLLLTLIQIFPLEILRIPKNPDFLYVHFFVKFSPLKMLKFITHCFICVFKLDLYQS